MILSLLALAHAETDSNLEQHVLSVLTSSEFGSSRSRTVRWDHSPALAIIGGTPQQRQLAEDISQTLSEAIAPLSIHLTDDPDAADIRLYFDRPGALREIAIEEGFTFVPGNSGLFWCWWDLRGRLTQTVILIEDTSAANSSWMQHLMLEEMTQSLGLMNDSTLFPQSLFYETTASSGTATSLSELDVKTIALLYGVRPGTREGRLRRVLRRRWEKL
ncbi:MAG: hypothetical protein ACI8RZ_006718 [Myxococcota bacterium]|jgi:hypothetical protein